MQSLYVMCGFQCAKKTNNFNSRKISYGISCPFLNIHDYYIGNIFLEFLSRVWEKLITIYKTLMWLRYFKTSIAYNLW